MNITSLTERYFEKIVIGENYQWHKNVLNIKFFL